MAKSKIKKEKVDNVGIQTSSLVVSLAWLLYPVSCPLSSLS